MQSGGENELVLLIRFKPRSTGKDLIQNEILQLLQSVRRQPGCLHFDLYRAENAAEWFLHQVWMNREAYERYQQSPEAGQLRTIFQRRTTAPPEEWILDRLSP